MQREQDMHVYIQLKYAKISCGVSLKNRFVLFAYMLIWVSCIML